MIDARKTIDFIGKMKFPLMIVGILILVSVFSVFFQNGGRRTAPKKKSQSRTEDSFFTGRNGGGKLSYDKFEIDPAPKSVTPEKKSEEKPRKLVRRPVNRPRRSVRKKTLPPIVSIYQAPPRPFEGVSDTFAPYGRLIECELIMTIDSASTTTPIIGLVTRDLCNDGKVIIPAGAEVHGTVTGRPIRDRVMSAENWVVVWRTRGGGNDGCELKLKGLALSLEAMYTPNSWNVFDGSAGIRGEVIKSTKMEELMAYAADFLATFTKELVQEQVTVTDWGQTTTNSGSTADAFNKGISSAVRKYADKLLEEVNRNGYFVRCKGGTRFYLYVKQTIDLEKATIAATKISNSIRRARR